MIIIFLANFQSKFKCRPVTILLKKLKFVSKYFGNLIIKCKRTRTWCIGVTDKVPKTLVRTIPVYNVCLLYENKLILRQYCSSCLQSQSQTPSHLFAMGMHPAPGQFFFFMFHSKTCRYIYRSENGFGYHKTNVMKKVISYNLNECMCSHEW